MGWFRRTFRGPRHAARDADVALREVLRLVLDDDLEAAEKILARIVKDDSDQIDAYLALARLYRRRGETGRAIRLHQNLLLRTDLPPEVRDEALLGLAGDFRQGGFLQRAIAAYEEVLDRRPRDVVSLRALVRLHADVRSFPRALELSRRLARVEGGDGRGEEARLLVESAEAAIAEGRSDEARRALKKALRRDPSSAPAWLNLGELEAEKGHAKRALAAWRKVPEVDRRRAPEVYPRLEATYAALGRARDFETELRKRLEEEPDDGEARLALARALAARGEMEGAAGEIRALLEHDPENLRGHAALTRALLAEGRESEAVKATVELLEVLDRRGLLDRRERIE
jgi:lipopolysaccharide biosynthesis regulator YciM